MTKENEFRQNELDRTVNSSVATMLNNGLDKLAKYLKKLQNIPVYSAAVALDPRFKRSYLEAQPFHQRSIESLKKQVRELWKTDYKSADMLPPPTAHEKAGFTRAAGNGSGNVTSGLGSHFYLLTLVTSRDTGWVSLSMCKHLAALVPR
jgi:hypothetical protein